MIGSRKELANFLVRWSVRLNAPKATAWLLWKSCRFLGSPEAKHHILCIRRSIFVDDLQALAEADSDGEFLFAVLPKSKLAVIMNAFLEESPQTESLTEFNYHSGLHTEALSRYNAFLEKVLMKLQNRWRVDAMLMANFGYKEQQELAKLARKHQLPFLILYKEGLLVPEHLDQLAPKYIDGKRFVGDKIMFYSEQIREAVLKSNAFDGVEFETAVTGIPRMDRLLGAPLMEKKQMVLFSFYPPDKFRSFGCSDSIYEKAVEAGDEFHRQVLRFAEQNPGWKVVIKTKAGDRYLDYVQNVMSKTQQNLSNIEVTNITSANKLLLESRVVLAFNSTTLLEALLAGRTIVSPDFRELFPEGAWDYFGKYPDLVCYARSAEDIGRIVEGGTGLPEDYAEERNAFLHELVNNSDGKASLRVLEELRLSIEASSGQREEGEHRGRG